MEGRAAKRRSVAEFLLEEKHLLTALEFLQELRETGGGGIQSATELLESFFNDAKRFPAEQVQLSSASLGTLRWTPVPLFALPQCNAWPAGSLCGTLDCYKGLSCQLFIIITIHHRLRLVETS